MSERLLYGKDPTTHIVSIEAGDGVLEIFKETSDGIENSYISNKFWILSNECFHKNMVTLKGSLHYKYGIQFNEREDFTTFYQKYRNKDLYRIFDPKESSMVNKGITYFKGMNIEDVSVLSFDIETTGLDPHAKDAKLLLISNTFRRRGKIEKKLFAFDEYETQGQMIEKWCQWLRKINPSVILGHNIYSFDLPYIYAIAEKEHVSMLMGRDDSPILFDKYESKFRKEASQFIHYKKPKVYGRELLDTLFLSIRHDTATRKYESYALKNIIKQEGLEKESRTFYDASQIRFKYKDKEEWKKIKSYAIDDADDSLSLYDLMIAPYFYFTQSIPKSFQEMLCSATGSQLNSLLVRSYLQEGHSIPKATDVNNFEGAISVGKPGIYKNCVRWDVSSLYPSIMRQYKIYDELKDPNKNFLNMVEYMTIERLKNKELSKTTGEKKYKYLEQSQKLGINSAYGLLNAPGLNFNSPKNAANVTRNGREILIKAIEWATGDSYEKWRNG